MSLRTRLTLLFSSLLGGTLLLFGALVYGIVSLVLVDQADGIIQRQATLILENLRVNSSGQYDSRLLASFQLTDSNLYFQVWGADQHLQYAVPRSIQQPLDPAARQSGKSVFATRLLAGKHLRVLSLPLTTNRGPAGTLQVAMNMNLLDVTLRALASVLFLLAVLSMGLAATLAWFILHRALAPLETVTEIATTITKADDLSRRIPISGSTDSEVGRMITAFNDTLSRLESMFATQRRFVADVSHELRTPLTVIKGEVSLLRKMGGVDEESLSSIESEVDRLTRLVGNLLLLAQAESGRLPLEMKPVELDTVLLDVLQYMHVLAGEKIALRLNEIDQITVMGDRDRLKQVLLNVISNAIQYTPTGGSVNISMSKIGDRARITVADTGPGIPSEDLPHIFERFYRGEKSRSRSQHPGFGLGLSIAFWIVRNHGGTIDVSSKEGKGTAFAIWLPIHPIQSGLVPSENAD